MEGITIVNNQEVVLSIRVVVRFLKKERYI